MSIPSSTASTPVVTGKPSISSAPVGRDEATGRSVVIALEELLRTQGQQLSMRPTSCGASATSAATPRILHERGGRVIGIGDHAASLLRHLGHRCAKRAGLRSKRSAARRLNRRTVRSGQRAPAQACDVLVPAALSAVSSWDSATTNCSAASSPKVPTVDDAGPTRSCATRSITVSARHLRQRRRRDRQLPRWVQNLQQFAWDSKGPRPS